MVCGPTLGLNRYAVYITIDNTGFTQITVVVCQVNSACSSYRSVKASRVLKMAGFHSDLACEVGPFALPPHTAFLNRRPRAKSPVHGSRNLSLPWPSTQFGSCMSRPKCGNHESLWPWAVRVASTEANLHWYRARRSLDNENIVAALVPGTCRVSPDRGRWATRSDLVLSRQLQYPP